MASNLPASVNMGQIGACLLRAARLAPDCSPLGGADTAVVTTGFASYGSNPDVQEGTVYEPVNACGEIVFTYERGDRIKRHNLSGELIVFDPEIAYILFGGEVLVAAAGSDFAGTNFGWASPNYNDPPSDGVYLEIISQNIAEGAGDCQTGDGEIPAYTGHIWGKAKLTLGDMSFEDGVFQLPFTGKATGNPNLYDGPWNDTHVVGYLRNTPYQRVYYSAAEYEAILALAAPGWQATPAAS